MLTLIDPPSLLTRNGAADTASLPGAPQRTLVAGEFLFREGDARDFIYRVERGAICLFKERTNGAREVLEFAFPGDFVGLGYLDNHISGAQATVDSRVDCVPRSALDPVLERSPDVKSRLSAAIDREVAFLKEAQVRAQHPKAIERIAALFVTLARCNSYEGRDPAVIADSLNCGVVAGYLDMSLDQLAEVLKELETRGLIAPSEKGLQLKNIDALERLADAGGHDGASGL